MDAAQAIADFTEISSQVIDVAVVVADGSLLASTLDDAAAARFAAVVTALLDEAEALRRLRGLPDVAQLEVATLEGSVFMVRRAGRAIVATTRPDPTVGLVFYDLKHCLRSLAETAVEAPGTISEPEAEPDAEADAALAPGRHARRKADASA